MAERLLEVSNLVKHFPMGRRQTVKAINDVSFHIDRGETLALVGESGSGKTTVGRCILRLIEPTEGRITFAGAQVDTMSANQLRALRPRVQMVFQEPYDSLNPRMRIRKIVEEPILLGGHMTPTQRHDRVAEVLEMVRLGADSMDKYPHQFSAGEQQRIGIARAISTEPELVVLDEPTSALDVSVRAEILARKSQTVAASGLRIWENAFCNKGLSRTGGCPRCPHTVTRICSVLHPSRTVPWSPRSMAGR